jgi:hypothetical protein
MRLVNYLKERGISMKRGAFKGFLVEAMELVSGIERDEIIINTDVEDLAVARIASKLTFDRPLIDVLDVSLADETNLQIFGEDFRNKLRDDGNIGATEFLKTEIKRARHNHNRPCAFRGTHRVLLVDDAACNSV